MLVFTINSVINRDTGDILNIQANKINSCGTLFAVSTDTDIQIYNYSMNLLRTISVQKSTSISINTSGDMLIAADKIYGYNYSTNTLSVIDDVYKTASVDNKFNDIYIDKSRKSIGTFRFLHDTITKEIKAISGINDYIIEKNLSALDVFINNRPALFSYNNSTGDLSILNYKLLGTETIRYIYLFHLLKTFDKASLGALKDYSTASTINVGGVDYKNYFSAEDYKVPNKRFKVKGFV